MHKSAKEFGKIFFETYCKNVDDAVIIDIGSQDVNGSLKEVSPPNVKYIGIDFVNGKGVDLILEDPYVIPLADESADIVVSSSCLEHSEMFWLIFMEMARILKPGGLLYINAPSNGMFHRYPVDCWRFYPDSGEALCKWANINSQPMILVESFIGTHFSPAERWNDFVAVFIKGEEFISRHSSRMTDVTDNYYNHRQYGTATINREKLFSEDQLKTFDLEKIVTEQEKNSLVINNELEIRGNLLSEEKVKNLNLEKLVAEQKNDLQAVRNELKIADQEKTHLLATQEDINSKMSLLAAALQQAHDNEKILKESFFWRVTSPLRILEEKINGRIKKANPAYYKFKREYYRILGKPEKVKKYNFKLSALKQKTDTLPGTIRTFGILTTRHTLFVAHAIAGALSFAGFKVQVLTDVPEDGWELDMYFVICPQIFSDLPPGEKRIAFQMEQSVSSRWFTKEYFDILTNSLAVLDYSQANIKYLEQHGIAYPHTFYVPISGITDYDPYGVRSVEKNGHSKEYDVVFYGDANNERRKALLSVIQKNFCTRIVSEVFGSDLHQEISKAKVVVNIHYYEGALLETTRIYECLSLGIPVVSETSADIAEHAALVNLVEFVDIGDTPALIAAIAKVLKNPPHITSKQLLAGQEYFRFMLYRAMLSMKQIDYDCFRRLTSGYETGSDTVCLSLPETVVRRAYFHDTKMLDATIFDGIRFSPGWIGCALSYKYICQKAIASSKSRLLICEDDAILPDDFARRLEIIEDHLKTRPAEWDIFAGMIAHLNPEAKIESVEYLNGETFITLNKMTSMVFNIYNKRAIQLISEWDQKNTDAATNTIDRYLEHSQDLRVVTTLPFLAGHHEDVNSSLWGFKNSQYNKMIADSEALLQEKVKDFIDLSHANSVCNQG